MAIYKSDIVDINLESGSIHRSYLNHTIGSGDNSANRFGVRTFRNGLSEDLSGASCQAIFMNAAGTNIALTSYGTVSGNEAYVTLPQACYNVEGQFTLAIKLVKSGETVTTRIVDGVVCNTGTTGAVAPTSSVPTYQEILDVYAAMQSATSAANTAIAETFDATKAYPAGKNVINDGALYVLSNGHTAGTTWANTTKVASNLGDQVTDLKSALPQFVADCPAEGFDLNQLTDNGIWTIRASRLTACTNIPTDAYSDCTLISQKTKTGVTIQRLYDGNGNVFIRTVNNSTHVAITDWANGIVGETGSSTKVGMTQKAITDALDTKIDASSFIQTYGEGTRIIQYNTLTSKSSSNVVQSSNDNYMTYKYEINGKAKFKVTGTIKGSSNYMFITATSENVFVDRQVAGTSTATQYTDETYEVNNSTVKYVYICLFNPRQDATTDSVKIQMLKTEYDDDQDTRIETLSAYGNRYIGKKIVCFGDSRTWYDGHEYTDKTKAALQGETCIGYQQQIRDLLGAIVDSQGVSGETSAEICTRIRAFDFTGYDAVLLEGGVNDFVKSGEVTIGEIAPIGSTFDTTTVYGAWQSAIEYIATNYPLVKIYMDIPAIAWLGTNDDVFPYNVAKIKGEIAELYSLPCKDLYKTSGINKVNRDAFYCDDTSLTNNWHLHFNDDGNALIGAELAMFINDN